jgi:hypothetical protein
MLDDINEIQIAVAKIERVTTLEQLEEGPNELLRRSSK